MGKQYKVIKNTIAGDGSLRSDGIQLAAEEYLRFFQCTHLFIFNLKAVLEYNGVDEQIIPVKLCGQLFNNDGHASLCSNQ